MHRVLKLRGRGVKCQRPLKDSLMLRQKIPYCQNLFCSSQLMLIKASCVLKSLL